MTSSNFVGCSTGKSAGLTPKTGGYTWTIGHETAGFGGLFLRKQSWQAVRSCKCRDTGALIKEHPIWQDDYGVSARGGDGGKCALEFVRG
jgi:hypothetical protein